MNASLTIRNGLLLALAIVGLAACGGDNDDLDQYVNEVKARPGGRIEPLPEITPYEVFTYIADAEACVHHLYRTRRRQRRLALAAGFVPTPIAAASFSRVFRSIPYAWLERCISARRCTGSYKHLTA